VKRIATTTQPSRVTDFTTRDFTTRDGARSGLRGLQRPSWLAVALIGAAMVACNTSPNTTGERLQTQATAIITTPWMAAAQGAATPLPEYPRPQMTRADWLNLNGKWSYFGGSAAPNAENPPGLAPGFPANAAQILVPYPAESYLSGIQRQNERQLWYKRSFTVPAGWNARRVILNFGAVDRQATGYVNGQQVGRHSGGYDAFSFDITTYLRAGANDLVVGAFDPTDGSGKCDMGQSVVQAAINLHNYHGVPYNRIELTPMIGGNDTQDESFTVGDVTTLANFVKQNGLAGVHYRSLDRDNDCAPGFASPTCNSYGQAGNWGFTNRFIADLGL
jgi:Glycosyl hydrolases family 2, sugar binding domain